MYRFQSYGQNKIDYKIMFFFMLAVSPVVGQQLQVMIVFVEKYNFPCIQVTSLHTTCTFEIYLHLFAEADQTTLC